MEVHLSCTFKPCEYFVLVKAKMSYLSKRAVEHSKILEENMLFNNSSSMTLTFGSKKHWQPAMELFLKEKLKLKM